MKGSLSACVSLCARYCIESELTALTVIDEPHPFQLLGKVQSLIAFSFVTLTPASYATMSVKKSL